MLLFVPTMFLYKAVAQFVNWRALTLTVILLLLVSLMWEATLAIPYGWWAYKSESMLGIMLPAWTNLPIEAVLLWLVAAWQTIFCYEFLRIFLHMKRGVRHALFGRADPADLDTDRESETQ